MKKLGSYLLIAVLVLSLALTAEAAEAVSCTVSADSVSAAAGGTVTVPVRIAENPGFTNFAIALDYDREQLELVSINVTDGENPYLCGPLTAVNTSWTGEDGQTYGYIVCAAPEQIAGDGILFAVTFHVKENFSGTAKITPLIQYIRDGSVELSDFDNIDAGIECGIVTSIRYGDLNDDGKLNSTDVSLARAIVNNRLTPSEAQFTAADVNGDGKISATDVSLLRAYVNNKLTQFPVESK